MPPNGGHQYERGVLFMTIITDKQKRELILEYEEVLVGKKKQFSSYYFSGNKTRDCEIALEVFRYFFDSILCWDIETLEQRLCIDLFRKYKLDKFLLGYIIFNNEPNKKVRFVQKEIVYADIQELLRMVYKDRYKTDIRTLTIETYEAVMNKKIMKFPKNFFCVANDGKAKACICLQYAINNQQTFRNVEELYRVFADRSIVKLLDKWRIRDIAEQFYNSPIEYLHDALPDCDKDETFFNYYKEKYAEVLKECKRSF